MATTSRNAAPPATPGDDSFCGTQLQVIAVHRDKQPQMKFQITSGIRLTTTDAATIKKLFMSRTPKEAIPALKKLAPGNAVFNRVADAMTDALDRVPHREGLGGLADFLFVEDYRDAQPAVTFEFHTILDVTSFAGLLALQGAIMTGDRALILAAATQHCDVKDPDRLRKWTGAAC